MTDMNTSATTYQRILGNDDGFSMVEIITVTLLLGFILAAAYMVLGTVSKISDDIIARNAAQSQGQLAIEKMERELRMGQSLMTGPQGSEVRLGQNSGTVVQFFADTDHDGTLQRITYTLANGKMSRVQATATKSYPNIPYSTDFGSDGAPSVLATVDPTLTSAFTYLDDTGASGVGQTQVSAVQIKLRTISGSGASTSMTVDFPTATVNVRSFQ